MRFPSRRTRSSRRTTVDRKVANEEASGFARSDSAFYRKVPDGLVESETHLSEGITYELEAGQSPIAFHAEDHGARHSNIWSMYLRRARRFDDAQVESWREDMESLLLFSAIFSATVTAFVIESYKKLQQDPNDLTAALLLRISDQLASSETAVPRPLSTTFQPTRAAIFYNTCWFLSLVFSLGCALGAILVRQWVLKYAQSTQNESQLPALVRTRHDHFEGIRRWKLGTFIELLPALLHFALFLFIMGLSAFTLEINSTVMAVVLAVSAGSVFIYVLITLLPLRDSHCPYQTPLSSTCLVLFAKFSSVWTSPLGNHSPLPNTRTGQLSEQKRSPVRSEGDVKALKWLWSALTDDREVVHFLRGIPGFIESFSSLQGDRLIPQMAIIKSVGDGINDLIQSCVADTLGRLELKHQMEEVAIACVDAIVSVTQAPFGGRRYIDLRYYFDSNSWHILQLFQHDSNPELAIPATCIIASINSHTLDRSAPRVSTTNAPFPIRRDTVTWQSTLLEQMQHDPAKGVLRQLNYLTAVLHPLKYLRSDCDLSDKQLQLLQRMLVPATVHARQKFITHGRQASSQLCSFLENLGEMASPSMIHGKPRLVALLGVIISSILLKDPGLQRSFEDMFQHSLLVSARHSPISLLDLTRSCMTQVLKVGREMDEELGTCFALNMPCTAADLRFILDAIWRDFTFRNRRQRRFLDDLLRYGSSWMSYLCCYGTVKDVANMCCCFIFLEDMRTGASGRGIFRFLFLFLDDQDIDYCRKVVDRFVWDEPDSPLKNVWSDRADVLSEMLQQCSLRDSNSFASSQLQVDHEAESKPIGSQRCITRRASVSCTLTPVENALRGRTPLFSVARSDIHQDPPTHTPRSRSLPRFGVQGHGPRLS